MNPESTFSSPRSSPHSLTGSPRGTQPQLPARGAYDGQYYGSQYGRCLLQGKMYHEYLLFGHLDIYQSARFLLAVVSYWESLEQKF